MTVTQKIGGRGGNGRVVDRIKKLLRLSQSSNRHEASSARARAEALMAEHGVVVSDEDDASTHEVVDDARKPGRRLLARDVAHSRGCRAFVNSAGWLAIYGGADRVASGAALYKDLVERGDRACESSYYGVPEVLRPVQRHRFWQGYVEVLGARLGALVAPAVTTTVQPREATVTKPPTQSAPDEVPTYRDVTDAAEVARGASAAEAEGEAETDEEADSGDGVRETPKAKSTPPAKSPPEESFHEVSVSAAGSLLKTMPEPNARAILAGILDNAHAAGVAAARAVPLPAYAPPTRKYDRATESSPCAGPSSGTPSADPVAADQQLVLRSRA